MKELKKKKQNRSSPSVAIVFRSGGGSWRDPCLFLSRQFGMAGAKGSWPPRTEGVPFPQIWLSTCKMLSIGNLKGFTGLKIGSDKKGARTKVRLRQQTLNPAIPQCQSKYFNSTSWIYLSNPESIAASPFTTCKFLCLFSSRKPWLREKLSSSAWHPWTQDCPSWQSAQPPTACARGCGLCS